MCVCVHRQFSSRVPRNRSLCVFCTFHRYFRLVPIHMQPKSVSCSSPLALDLCTVVLPSAASVPVPRFGWNQQTLTEHCRIRQASSERQLRMSGCLLCLFGWMCSFSVKNRLKWLAVERFLQNPLWTSDKWPSDSRHHISRAFTMRSMVLQRQLVSAMGL